MPALEPPRPTRSSGPPEALRAVRRAIAGILALALVGTLAELLLLQHFEDWQQWIPLALLSATTVVLVWSTRRPTAARRRLLQLCMLALVAAGAIGVILHLEGNLEFEREISPELGGFALWSEVLRGATPALAPGSLVPFGLLGLLYTILLTARSREDS